MVCKWRSHMPAVDYPYATSVWLCSIYHLLHGRRYTLLSSSHWLHWRRRYSLLQRRSQGYMHQSSIYCRHPAQTLLIASLTTLFISWRTSFWSWFRCRCILLAYPKKVLSISSSGFILQSWSFCKMLRKLLCISCLFCCLRYLLSTRLT